MVQYQIFCRFELGCIWAGWGAATIATTTKMNPSFCNNDFGPLANFGHW